MYYRYCLFIGVYAVRLAGLEFIDILDEISSMQQEGVQKLIVHDKHCRVTITCNLVCTINQIY